MARIRTIKPEFPQSESMGRLSRDARLLFVLMWTIADDEGRLRGSSRFLCGQLFPYDDDVRESIDSWVDELVAEECIVRYTVNDSQYVQIVEWKQHQKIDRPTKSRFPDPPYVKSSMVPREASRALDEPSMDTREPSTNPREASSEDLDLDLDQGPRTIDPGPKGARASDAVSEDFLKQFPGVKVPGLMLDDPLWVAAIRKWFAHLMAKSRLEARRVTDITVQNHIDEMAGRGRDRSIEVINNAISSHAWKLYWDYRPPQAASDAARASPEPVAKKLSIAMQSAIRAAEKREREEREKSGKP